MAASPPEQLSEPSRRPASGPCSEASFRVSSSSAKLSTRITP